MIARRSCREVRTLVVHTGGIGDFLLFCPCLKRLAEDGPVDLAGNDRDRLNLAVVSGLAQIARHLDDIEFGSLLHGPGKNFSQFVAGFDRAIVWMNDREGKIHAAIEGAGVPNVNVMAGLPPTGWSKHASDYYANQLGYMDLPPLRLSFAAVENSHDVLIHPGSGARRKNWPAERFEVVADELTRRGRSVMWICGPAEEGLHIPSSAPRLEVASVVTLARHLSAARLYLGNDSGVTHLAAACGCPTVAIFGPTDPRIWAPRGDHVAIVASRPRPEIDDVLNAIGLLESGPCAGA